MAGFTRIEVATAMYETGLVPVFFDADIGICLEVLAACARGGARLFEFTNRGDRAHAVFSELVERAAVSHPDVIVGAGSVVEAGTASLYMQLGASFIVSPILDAATARVCNRRKVLWSPGCGTLNEISRAEELGAEIVKIFPGAAVGGPAFVRAVRGPCPWTSLMPTGGVAPTEDNLRAWFEAGVACVGIGSQLVPRAADGSIDLAETERLTREALAIIARVRSSSSSQPSSS